MTAVAWSFELNYAKPPRGLAANDTGSRWYRINATKVIRSESFTRTRAAHVPALERIRIDVEWVVATRRNRDASNLGLFTKPIYDGICASKGISAHIVDDDSPGFCETPIPTIRYAPDEAPRFIVTITDLGIAP